MSRPNKPLSDYSALFESSWREPMGLSHHNQGVLTVMAPTKVAAQALLAAVGIQEHSAAYQARRLRVDQSTPTQRLLEAGILDPSVQGVYAYRDNVNNGQVFQILPDGPVVVGRFTYGPDPHSHILIAEKVSST